MDNSERNKDAFQTNKLYQKSFQTQQTIDQPLQKLYQQKPQPVIPIEQQNSGNQVYAYQQQIYVQPIVISPVPQNVVVKNQVEPSKTPIDFDTLYSVSTTCPYCNKNIKTIVKEKFSCCSCFCCCLMVIFFPVAIYECLRSCSLSDICDCRNCCNCHCDCKCKGKCCFDGSHYCPYCRNLLGEYDSYKNL